MPRDRQFCSFVHARLGRGVSRVTPSCVVNVIREKYPSEKGQYTGFKDGVEAFEINFSCVRDM